MEYFIGFIAFCCIIDNMITPMNDEQFREAIRRIFQTKDRDGK